MFGKHFASLYEGSMIGAGSAVFAVWGYVIANQKPDATVGAQVDLNPRLLAFVIGDKEDAIIKAIEFLCSPDANSRSKDEGGKRLVRLGQFSYRVVNGAKYLAIRDEEARREYNRNAKRKERLLKKRGKPLPGEIQAEAAIREGATEEEVDDIVAENLPPAFR